MFFYDFLVVVVILFYQSFVVINVVTLFYENVILYSYIVKLNYFQTRPFLLYPPIGEQMPFPVRGSDVGIFHRIARVNHHPIPGINAHMACPGSVVGSLKKYQVAGLCLRR